MQNCGLKALEKLTEIRCVSMFTLIHLAKDNGVNLYFCKVEPEELVQVARPAIFHQKDHFVFIENGEAMPSGVYDGYVLTPKPLHEPLPYSLAKKIRGQKDASGILQPIAIGLTSVINPVLGAVVGAGFGAAKAAGAFGDEGKGEWWRVATGGLSGMTGASNPMISAMSAAAGEVPSAIKSGNWMSPIGAGLGQYGSNLGAGGFSQGFSNNAGSGFLNQVEGGLKGGVQALAGGGSASGGGGIQGGMATPAGYSGSVTVPGIGSTSLSAARRLAGGGMQSSSLPGQGGGGDFNLSNIVGGGKNMKMLGAAASSLLPRPELQGDIMGNYAKSAQYLGGDNYNALPTATRDQLEKYVNTPLSDLAQEFTAQDDKGLRMLEEKKQGEVDQLMSTYANYGQDPYTSTDAQQKLTEVNRQYDQAISEYQQQIQNQAMSQAVKFKQEMLQNAMQQGSFDYDAAMELATYVGRDQEMKYAMESKDHEALQNVLAEIFSI